MPHTSAALDGDFNLYHNLKHLQRMRGAMAATIVLMLMFGLLDVYTLPAAVYTDTLKIRFLLILPIAAAGWLATYVPSFRPRLQEIISSGALVVGVGIVGIIWIGRNAQIEVPYEGLILVTMFFYFLVGLRSLGAMICGWAICGAYVAVEAQAGLIGETLFINAFFLVMANVIGSVGVYFQDEVSRENFEAERSLIVSAEKDFLTGLLNRRALDTRAQLIFRQAAREKRPVAVAMMDVDHFKAYNDHYGHSAGDDTLRAVAQAIARCSQRPLDITARFGGEEFVAIWYGLSGEQALDLAETTRKSVENLAIRHEKSGLPGHVVTISIGLVWLTPADEQDFEKCVRLADAALYEAKHGGRNRVACAQVVAGPQSLAS